MNAAGARRVLAACAAAASAGCTTIRESGDAIITDSPLALTGKEVSIDFPARQLNAENPEHRWFVRSPPTGRYTLAICEQAFASPPTGRPRMRAWVEGPSGQVATTLGAFTWESPAPRATPGWRPADGELRDASFRVDGEGLYTVIVAVSGFSAEDRLLVRPWVYCERRSLP